MVWVQIFCFAWFLCNSITMAFIPGLYCGERNCYDEFFQHFKIGWYLSSYSILYFFCLVLGMTRDSSKQEIAKVYRKLAGKYHPDKVKGEDAKKNAEEKFRLVATAYETLKDEETRRDYDYMLDHPDEFYRHYFNYYRRRVAPKVDVRIVVAGLVLAISLFQYVSAHHKYQEAISSLLSQHRYRLQAMEIAKERGLLANADNKKGKRRRDKDEIKEQEELIIRRIIEENVDIKGSYRKPHLLDTLVFQILFIPYILFNYITWWLRWIWKFWIIGSEYEKDDQLYLIRKNMGISRNQFDTIDDKQKDEYLAKELWRKSNFEQWRQEIIEDGKRKMAENSKHRRYRRYMKNNPPGQISFVDD